MIKIIDWFKFKNSAFEEAQAFFLGVFIGLVMLAILYIATCDGRRQQKQNLIAYCQNVMSYIEQHGRDSMKVETVRSCLYRLGDKYKQKTAVFP